MFQDFCLWFGRGLEYQTIRDYIDRHGNVTLGQLEILEGTNLSIGGWIEGYGPDLQLCDLLERKRNLL